ncbi:YybS family protein [Pullulanibacillus sp. KACC 23026]|uniref:YybS family protein n=1 Tax=Pullulanibacillus sp. KACC 23026 TaxID=3028315 RepID=UPI0023B05CE8|nr:YybS family protein [Pullulanibacillus sp. KACC 23026]WEG12805.1 YybS family protein [Pullulanibacillus sp. KACC 23026]
MANRTRMITEGAASTVLFVIILLLTSYVPIIGIISIFLLPIPIMYFTSKQGYKSGLIVFLSCFIITILVTDLLRACVAVFFLLIGLVMGELLKRKCSAIQLLIAGTCSNIVVLLIAYGICAFLFHINPINWITNQILKSIDLTLKMSPYLQGNKDAMKQFEAMRAQAKNMSQLAPALLVAISAMYALIIEILSGAVLKRLRVPFPKWQPFREWRFQRQLVWYYLGDLILMYWVGDKWGSTGSMVFYNIFYILEIIMVIQGLAFIYYFFYQRKQGLLFPNLITVFSILIPPVLYIVLILGIIDLGFDFRSRIKSR